MTVFIRSAVHSQVLSSCGSPADHILERLVLHSGNRGLERLAQLFRLSPVDERSLYLRRGSVTGCERRLYRQYEQQVRLQIRENWSGPARALKQRVRALLQPFRSSRSMLRRLLATPVRIIAAGCLLVMLNGTNHTALSATPDQRPLISSEAKPQPIRQNRDLYVVDNTLADLDILLAALPDTARVVRLDPGKPLFTQILDSLLCSGPTERLHLVTHGEPGRLLFGAGRIDIAELTAQADLLELMGALLGRHGEINLYGCSVAEGALGEQFVRTLAELTTTLVAASDDPTGASHWGGDWDLELVTGTRRGTPFSAPDYSRLLATGKSGVIRAGDGSGGGGGGGGFSGTSGSGGGAGGAGGGGNDTLNGTDGDDVLFGDGSGGGGGGHGVSGGYSGTPGKGGAGGGGNDQLSGGAGDDILFGDGFDGFDGNHDGGNGGFGGGGGGGGGNTFAGGMGGIGGGGGGGGDQGNGGNGGYGGGGGGAGSFYGSSPTFAGSGGGFFADNGTGPTAMSDAGGGGGGGGFPSGAGGAGGYYQGKAGSGGHGGWNVSSETGGGDGGEGGANSSNNKGDAGGGGGGGFGGGAGGSGANSTVNTAQPGSAGGESPVTLEDDSSRSVYTYVLGKLDELINSPGGAGNDTLDGGPGSDHLFGMGGTNIFVFESNGAADDTDTIHDWNRGTGNRIKLTTDGVVLTEKQVAVIIGNQAANGSDRSIVHSSGSGQVTIVVKGIGRDLKTEDFLADRPGFNWSMFLPAIIGHD